jgi:4-hydroxy-2-oxoglutarate aldolase
VPIDLHTVLVPVTTPFEVGPNHLFAPKAFAQNINMLSQTGIGGFVILGSTGERVHLDETAYLEVIETAREATPTDLTFIVGAGQQSTDGTIKEIRKAAQLGADAVLVITPYFYRTAITQEVLLTFYTTVADASPVPLVLYSMPALTGVKIEPATIARLSSHPNIIGAKDSSADLVGFRETVKLCCSDFAVMTGNGTVFLDALKAGATGAILAVGCAVPEICVEIFRAFNAHEYERAATLQSKLTPFAHAVTVKFGIAGLKAALTMNGYCGGAVRPPLLSVNETARSEIGTLLRDLDSTFKSLTSRGEEKVL